MSVTEAMHTVWYRWIVSLKIFLIVVILTDEKEIA